MRTIPPDSRTAIAYSDTSFVTWTSTQIPREPADRLTLVASTQTYLACVLAGVVPVADQRQAWDEFYRSYAPVVHREARGRHRCRDTSLAADAQQDIWLAIVERLGSFRIDAGLGSFPGWLRTVARRCLADGCRAEIRRPVPRTWDAPPIHLAGPEVDPAEACERADDQARLASLLKRLHSEVSVLNYRVLHLRSIEERSAAEVGHLLGLTAEQVRVRHHRMLGRLRSMAGEVAPQKNQKISPRRATPGRLVTC